MKTNIVTSSYSGNRLTCFSDILLKNDDVFAISTRFNS
jgi:hypothetical protein